MKNGGWILARSAAGWMKPFHNDLLPEAVIRKVPFIIRDANRVDRDITMRQCHDEIVEQFDDRLSQTGFLAGTDEPSFADISAYAQLVCSSTLGMEGAVLADSSPPIQQFYRTMSKAMDLVGQPELVPGWQPMGLSPLAETS